MGKLLSNEEFVRRIHEAHPNIIPLEPYINSRTKLKFKCLDCGLEWYARANNVMHGNSCPNCMLLNHAKTQPIPHDEYMNKFNNSQISKAVRVIGEYTGTKNKLLVECIMCGRQWNANPQSLLKGHGCKSCSSKLVGEHHKMTHEEFVRRVHENFPNYIIVGLHTTTQNKIEVMCDKGHTWFPYENNLLKGEGCPTCAHELQALNRMTSNEKFIERLKTINPDITPIEQYKGNKKRIKVKCPQGHVWEAYPSNLYKRQGCPVCSGRQGLTRDEFLQKLHDINPNIEITIEYISLSKDVTCRCLIDGYVWKTTPSKLLSGRGCRMCYGSVKLTIEEVKRRVLEVSPNITIIGEYKNVDNPIECICEKCGYVWSSIVSNLFKGRGCPSCNGCLPKTTDSFKQEIKNIHPHIQITGKYVNAHTKIDYYCDICHNTHQQTPHNLLRGYGCPSCCRSKGELEIQKYLDDINCEYEINKSFDDLHGIGEGHLSYDFYLPQYNMLIEYQGIQHAEPTDFKGLGIEYSEDCFKKQVEHDKRKREYALNNGYVFLEIWFTDFANIKEILMSKIKKELKE